jgi:4-amino-4-deoxy-L-arabinose transferase-like glycosyltransferase
VNRLLLLIAGAVTLLLVAFASGYGYHRDELYFLAAGQHLDWAYADQGPLTPLIARAMSEVAPDSLTVLRLPSAIAAGLTVLLTGLLARELGGSRRAEAIAASCAAVATTVLFTGHLLNTSTFDLLVWTALTWLAVRAVRTGKRILWLVAGVVLGFGLLNKPLPAFLVLGMLAGVAIAGPRRLLRDPYVWGGAAIALALWTPWIVWQADHGWPQIDVSREIAAGGSTSSEPWWAIVPFQALLAGPLLAPVWIAGLIRLFRDASARDYRFIGWAWVVLAIVFMTAGGKPYYLAGLLPALIGAGAVEVDGWLGRGRTGLREAGLVGAIAASGAVSLLIALPVLPADKAGPVIALNEDVGETIGWPEFARTVAGVHRSLPNPDNAVILAGNYGEAGAIDRYGPGLGLPRAHSGHNAYGDWGPPPDGSGPVIVVGYDRPDSPVSPSRVSENLATNLDECRAVATVGNDAGVENQEQGRSVLLCDGPRRPWSRVWPELRHLG